MLVALERRAISLPAVQKGTGFAVGDAQRYFNTYKSLVGNQFQLQLKAYHVPSWDLIEEMQVTMVTMTMRRWQNSMASCALRLMFFMNDQSSDSLILGDSTQYYCSECEPCLCEECENSNNFGQDGQPTTFWQCSALHPHPLPSSWWRAAFYLSLGVVVRLPRPCATTFLGPRRAGRPPRVCGKKFAELPLIGTRVQYRRQGMCRLLMNEVEKLLSGLGVERLLLPTVPQLLETWTGSFGFTEMSYSDRFQYAANIILSFQGTTMCQKILNDVCHNRKDTSLHLALNAERMELGNNILNSSKRSTTCDMVVDNASNHSEELKVTSLAKFDSLELAENCIFSSGGTTICQKVSSDAFYHPKDNDLSPSLSLSLIVMLTEHFLLGYLGKLSISASGIPK